MSNCFFFPQHSSKRSTHKSCLLATTCQTNNINHVWVRGPVTETMLDRVSGHQAAAAAAAAGFDIIMITFNSVSMKDSSIGSRCKNLFYLWWPSRILRRAFNFPGKCEANMRTRGELFTRITLFSIIWRHVAEYHLAASQPQLKQRDVCLLLIHNCGYLWSVTAFYNEEIILCLFIRKDYSNALYWCPYLYNKLNLICLKVLIRCLLQLIRLSVNNYIINMLIVR